MKYSALLLPVVAISILVGACSGSAEMESEPIGVMTFNIRYDNPADGVSAWPNRREWVANIIAGSDVAVVGLQEALHHQVTWLDSVLSDFDYVGVGRNDGAMEGEYAPIFYDTGKVTLSDQGTFWLSEHPDSVGSVGWDAALTRITSWARFDRSVPDESFYVFNSHFDHRGEEARLHSAELVRERASSIAGNTPYVLTGDFNTIPEAPPYAALTAHVDGIRDVSDTIEAAGETADTDTFRGFEAGQETTRRIDYIFPSMDWSILSHEVLGEVRDGRYPSDHVPVVARLQPK